MPFMQQSIALSEKRNITIKDGTEVLQRILPASLCIDVSVAFKPFLVVVFPQTINYIVSNKFTNRSMNLLLFVGESPNNEMCWFNGH